MSTRFTWKIQPDEKPSYRVIRAVLIVVLCILAILVIVNVAGWIAVSSVPNP